jgi:1-deoxy-D-xylulose-5-phosphate reductoisomerase
MTRLSLLGSTGSIGQQCLDLASRMPEQIEVVGLGAGRRIELLASQARQFRPKLVVCAEPSDLPALRRLIDDPTIETMAGDEGQRALATLSEAQTVVAAVVGFAGLTGTLAAAKSGKRIALANKESLVAAGELLTDAVRQGGAEILPVDSEHAALHQCLAGEQAESVHRLWLTASGGPFRGRTRAELESISVDQALDHPNWSMGPKVTIDSATLMNKGLELIEAAWLFSQPPEAIKIAVHPPSLVHSMVEFIDGTFKAQLGAPDMRAAIAYAISAPARLPLLACEGVRPWNPLTTPLAFEDYDRSVFRAPDLCREALRLGGGAPAALNAINEELVAQFLAGKRAFLSIGDELARGLEVVAQRQLAGDSLKAIFAADQVGRAWAR